MSARTGEDTGQEPLPYLGGQTDSRVTTDKNLERENQRRIKGEITLGLDAIPFTALTLQGRLIYCPIRKGG